MTKTNHPSGAPWRNFYGRFKGKGLRDSQKTYLDEDLARLSPGPVDWDVNPDRSPLDTAALFDGRPVWLEVGFGGGEHLVHQAHQNPEIGIIGCEPYINGVAMLLGKIRKAGVDNLRVHPGDVRDLFDVLPDRSVARAFLLYPDPWPKKRHHRRRFVMPEYLQPLARVMQPGAIFSRGHGHSRLCAPDAGTGAAPRLRLAGRAARGLAHALGGLDPHPLQQKALREGRVPHYLTFRRRDD
jgi:Predicted S-adenosylmethionine-dependent methyltransferase